MSRFAFLLLVAAAPNCFGGIVVNYSGPAQFSAAFTAAESIWESHLTGYQGGVVDSLFFGASSYSPGQLVTDVIINAEVVGIDGVGGILGQAGPTAAVTDNAGFRIATNGIMQFDSADVQNLVTAGTWEDVILHEMGHVLGLGTLWTQNGVYVTDSGEYTGARATAQWQSEFGQTGTPDVELAGGAGTRNAHWNENDGGAGLTGITDTQGRDMRDELMTGWLNGNTFISRMTIESFADIGFTVSAVPEPSSLTVLLSSSLFFVRRRHRR